MEGMYALTNRHIHRVTGRIDCCRGVCPGAAGDGSSYFKTGPSNRADKTARQLLSQQS